MVGLSIDSLWNSCIVFVAMCLCSLVTPSQQTATFSNSLFSPSKTSSCSHNAQSKAKTCLSKLSPLKFMSGPPSGGKKKALEDGCVEGHFFDAVNCIERVMLDCRFDKSEAAYYLRSNINVAKMRNGIVHFCTHFKTFTSNLECVQESLPYTRECGQEAKDKFVSQMKATQNLDSQLRFQCPFFSKTVSCVKSVLKSRCNKEISSIAFTVMAGMEPPICSKTIYSVSMQQDLQDDGNGSVSIQTHVPLSYMCFVLFLLLGSNSVRW